MRKKARNTDEQVDAIAAARIGPLRVHWFRAACIKLSKWTTARHVESRRRGQAFADNYSRIASDKHEEDIAALPCWVRDGFSREELDAMTASRLLLLRFSKAPA